MRSKLSILLKSAYRKAQPDTVNADRRRFLRNSALATVALALPLGACVGGRGQKIAIVGGGLAGLTTSFQLSKLGIEHTVYEASGRVGGRVLTVEDAVVQGAHVDFGAEFIDSTHRELLALAKELNVETVDLHEDTLISKCYHFEGKTFSEAQLTEALSPFAERLAEDVARIPVDIHFSKAEDFRDLDDQSVAEYLKGIGMDGWLLSFFEMAMEGEYAMNAGEQSAVNLLVMLSTPISYAQHYHLFGNYHEVHKFKGGSQRIVEALSKRVMTNVKTDRKLTQLSQKGQRYELQFESSQGSTTETADIVVLAMPHTVLREVKRDFRFGDRKEKWIAEAGFGNAIKVAMGFSHRVWREAGYQGYTFTDINRTVFWDSSQMLTTEEGSLTFAGGGNSAVELAAKSYEEIKAKWLVGADQIYKGLTNAYTNRISKFPWVANPFSKGSYTCYRPGQWSEFAGVESEPFGNIFFAGEHCSVKHQGFMNGAVETATRVAQTIGQLMKQGN